MSVGYIDTNARVAEGGADEMGHMVASEGFTVVSVVSASESCSVELLCHSGP